MEIAITIAITIAISISIMCGMFTVYWLSSLRYVAEKMTENDSFNIFVLRAHVCDDALKRTLYNMRNELDDANVFLAFDESRGRLADIDPYFAEANAHAIIALTQDMCSTNVPNGMHDSMWANVDCTVVESSRFVLARRPDMQYMWLVESDVYCNGSYRTAFAHAHSLAHDFLATNVEEYGDNNNHQWVWWDNLKGDIAGTPRTDQVKSFFPITRFSRAMLAAVTAEYGRSSGFCEVFFPTLARKRGLTFASLPAEMGIIQYDEINSRVPAHTDNMLYHKYIHVS
jgi:hypothetical protein